MATREYLAIHHHGQDRVAFHTAASAAVLAACGLPDAQRNAHLCIYAWECPACGHVDFSGAAGGNLTPCCGLPAEEQDRRVTVLLAGHAYDAGLVTEIAKGGRGLWE